MSIVLSVSTANSLTLIKLIHLDFTIGTLLASLALAVLGLSLDLALGAVVGTLALPFVALALGMVLALIAGEFGHEIRTTSI